jgi:L-fuconolactonase
MSGVTPSPAAAPAAWMIDAHQHFWDPRVRAYPWMDESVAAIDRPIGPADLREAIAGTPVAGSVVVQALHDLGESFELLEITTREDVVLGAVVWVDLAAPDVADRLAELREHPGQLSGIRHQVHDEPDADWLRRPEVIRGLKAVQDAGLAFDLLIRRRESAAAIALAEELPGLTLVLDHAGKPAIASGEWDDWRQWFGRLAALPNVSCKLSGLVTEASWTGWREQGLERYGQHVLDAFGAERTLFGSDWPVSLLAARYDEVVDLAWRSASSLSDAERTAVFAGNARRIYALEETS